MGMDSKFHTLVSLNPGKDTLYPLYRGLGGPQARSGRVGKICPPPGFDPRTLQSETSRYTDYAILAHTGLSEIFIFRISPRPSRVPERVGINKKDFKMISSLHKKT
jgi:hypothetical protein